MLSRENRPLTRPAREKWTQHENPPKFSISDNKFNCISYLGIFRTHSVCLLFSLFVLTLCAVIAQQQVQKLESTSILSPVRRARREAFKVASMRWKLCRMSQEFNKCQNSSSPHRRLFKFELRMNINEQSLGLAARGGFSLFLPSFG